MPLQHPSPFLDIRIHEQSTPGLTALCAGYECGEWRSAQLARHLMEWLPEFALSHKEVEALGAHNATSLLLRAANAIYNTRTASPIARDKRGEIGELLLHVAIRQVFNTLPAISKFYFKDTANETVKGFDAVHVVASEEALELWLGEVKFYTDIAAAIRDVVGELERHMARDYLRGEFATITNKIDDRWPYADRLKKLLDPNFPLDRVFDCMAVPVLLTYESGVIASHKKSCDEFHAAFEEEIRTLFKTFSGKNLPDCVRIHLFLFPMGKKKALVEEFDRRLAACQSIGS